jgi:lysophospholipase L1-like esterase
MMLARRAAARRRWSFRLAAAVLGTAIALGAVELVLRAIEWNGWVADWEEGRRARIHSIWIKSANRALIYQHRPDYWRNGVRQTERHGILRPTDVSVQAASGTFRVAALGDSVSAALAVPYERRVFTLVESGWTARSTVPVEVLNFGVNGYSTLQEAALVGELVAAFRPDMIILQYCVNDFYPTYTPSAWFRDRPSLLLDLLRRQFDRRVIHGFPGASYFEEQYRTDRSGWDGVRAGFERIGGYARERSIPALLVIFPLLESGGWYRGAAARRHAQIAELGRETGFAVLDLLPIYSRYPVRRIRQDPWDNLHPNPFGHQLAASAILERAGQPGPASDR